MKLAFISDLHANATALKPVLQAIEDEHVDRIVCLGDIVGFHTEPGECIDMVQSYKVMCLAGNHDEGVRGTLVERFFPRICWEAILWTREHLKAQHLEFLRLLPRYLALDDHVFAMHGTLDLSYKYLAGPVRIRRAALRLKMAGFTIAFHGHTHLASCCRIHGRLAPWSVHKVDISEALLLSNDAQYFLNPGSVGQPRTHDPHSTYAIFDTREKRVVWRTVQHDYKAVIQKTLAIFPNHRDFYNGFVIR